MGKYADQAGNYSRIVQRVKDDLETGILLKIDNSLGIKSKISELPRNTDILTYNVIISNQEIREELNDLMANLNSYKNVMSDRANYWDNWESTKLKNDFKSEDKKELN